MHDAARCAQSCGGASLFYRCWRLSDAVRRPNPVRTAAVERAPPGRAERPEVADAAVAAAPRAPPADRAEVAAPAVARRIRSGVLVASRAPALVIPAAVPASRVRRWTAEPARPDRGARPAPEVLAGAAAPPARAAAVAALVDRAGRADPRSAVRALARATSFACTPAAAARRRGATRSPMAANVRRDGPTKLSATLHQPRGQAARSRRACLPLLSAPRGPRRAAQPSPARAFRGTSANRVEDAASSAEEKSYVSRRDHLQARGPAGCDRHAHDDARERLRRSSTVAVNDCEAGRPWPARMISLGSSWPVRRNIDRRPLRRP